MHAHRTLCLLLPFPREGEGTGAHEDRAISYLLGGSSCRVNEERQRVAATRMVANVRCTVGCAFMNMGTRFL